VSLYTSINNNSNESSFYPFVERWLYSTDHKDIGTLYFIIGAFSGMLGTMMSVYIRMELSYPSVQVLAENHQLYNVLVTAHAFLMIFFHGYAYFNRWFWKLVCTHPYRST